MINLQIIDAARTACQLVTGHKLASLQGLNQFLTPSVPAWRTEYVMPLTLHMPYWRTEYIKILKAKVISSAHQMQNLTADGIFVKFGGW